MSETKLVGSDWALRSLLTAALAARMARLQVASGPVVVAGAP